MSPLRDYWSINLLVLRLNFSWLRLTSWSVHLLVFTWNSRTGGRVNIKGLLPEWLRAMVPGRLYWQQWRRYRR